MRFKTESLRHSESKREKKRVAQGAGDVPMESGTEVMSRWRSDMRTHLSVTSEKTQHEEDRVRDIQIGKRGPEAASEENPDKLRKTARFEQEAPSDTKSAGVRTCAHVRSCG